MRKVIVIFVLVLVILNVANVAREAENTRKKNENINEYRLKTPLQLLVAALADAENINPFYTFRGAEQLFAQKAVWRLPAANCIFMPDFSHLLIFWLSAK